MTFSYAAAKLSTARSALMLPHPQGEERSIVSALFECSLGLQSIKREALDDGAARWFDTLQRLMNVNGLSDVHGEGLFYEKALAMTEQDKADLSHAVDELESWLSHREEP